MAATAAVTAGLGLALGRVRALATVPQPAAGPA